MPNVVQFRGSTAILGLVAASIGGGLIAAFAVASHTSAPISVTARADTNTQRVSQLSNSFADIIEKASPAVVKISTTRVVKVSEQQGNNPFMTDPFFRQFFGGQNGARPRDQRERGLGSGVIVNSSGYILTNNHVVDKATILKVELSDGRDFTAKVVGADPQTDVAVVKIDSSNLPTLSFADSGNARVGDLCFAIGNPFGQDHTVTMGIISAKGRNNLRENRVQIQDFIQTDASINPGNSGGALINARGELIGMNTMILTGGNSFGGEGGNVGIGFAVPSNLAKQVLDQLVKNGKVSRGYMGVALQGVSQELASQFGLKSDHGAIVADVTPGKPGDKAGLKSGDVILKIDGEEVKDSNDLTMKVTNHAPGSSVALDVVRNGQPMKINVTLGQRPTGLDWENSAKGGDDNDKNGDDDNASADSASVRGIGVENLTPAATQELGIPATTKGVVVTSVDADSPAADAVGRGSVIVAVDRHPVTNVGEFKRLMAQAQGKPVLLTTNNGGNTSFTVVQPK
jgi:serine protease Do